MTAKTKQKFEKFITPVGTAKYPRLSEPDFKFKENGEYSVKLIVPAEEAAELTERLEGMLEAHVAAVKKDINTGDLPPVKKKQALAKLSTNPVAEIELNDETGEETGNVIFKAAMPGSFMRNKGQANEERIDLKPNLFDAKGKQVHGVRIGGGSKLRVAGYIKPYYIPGTGIAGVRLALDAVQIIELVQYQQRDAANYGFGVEDGFEVDDTPANAPAAASAAGTETENADF